MTRRWFYLRAHITRPPPPRDELGASSGVAVRIQGEGEAAAAAADGTSSPPPWFLPSCCRSASRSKNFEEEKSEAAAAAALKSTPDAREIRGRTDAQHGDGR